MSQTRFVPGFELLLASESPRRRNLLALAGVAFEVRPSGIEEIIRDRETAATYVARLAREKAASLHPSPNQGVLAADTTVVLLDAAVERILEKPSSPAEAVSMLTALQGRSHFVLTAVCFRFHGDFWSCVERTDVQMAAMSPAEIDAYVASGEPFGKAGAYAIQGLASRYVTRLEGCYFNVVGLPIHQVFQLFAQAGVLAKL